MADQVKTRLNALEESLEFVELIMLNLNNSQCCSV